MFYNLYVLSLKNIKQNVIIINNRERKKEKGERSMNYSIVIFIPQ